MQMPGFGFKEMKMDYRTEYSRWLRAGVMKDELKQLSDREMEECFHKELELEVKENPVLIRLISHDVGEAYYMALEAVQERPELQRISTKRRLLVHFDLADIC